LAAGRDTEIDTTEAGCRMDTLDLQREEIDAKIAHMLMLAMIGGAA
jgi:hypothetical protein